MDRLLIRLGMNGWLAIGAVCFFAASLSAQEIPATPTAALEPPAFSHARGYYEQPFQLRLSTSIENAAIVYTDDGSEPSLGGLRYQAPIQIETTAIIRAAVFGVDSASSPSVTHTYLFLGDVIRQTRPSGHPLRWGSNVAADYDMDPDIVDHPDYAGTILGDLKSIPSVSIVMDHGDLFGAARGIYVNTEKKGVEWERAASTEWIETDPQKGFQINNGIRIQGGYSRLPDRKKHSFRLLFKREYGKAKLNYPVFDHSHVDRFDALVLRGNYNYTWHAGDGGFGSDVGHAEYIRDEFGRRTQLQMGQPASHGTYANLYLNGLYWGVYNVCERPDDSFSEEYFGGAKEEYDVITGGTRGLSTTQVKAGNKDAWTAMMQLVQAGNFDLDANYQAIQEYVDLDNLIDYMLAIYYTGNRDAPTVIGGGGTPWNFYTTRHRKPGAGLKTYVWDSEWCLEEPDRNVVEFHRGKDNPALIFQRLRANPEFAQRVADRIQTHFFNGGALTAEASIQRYTRIAEHIEGAIVGESARWGDARGGPAKTRNEDWLNEVYRLLTTYFPVRTDIVVQQLRDSNWFPDFDSPIFNHSGGEVEPSFGLAMQSRKIVKRSVPLLAIDAAWKYNQTGDAPGAGWKNPGFDDSSWVVGKALLYVENSPLPAVKNTLLRLGQTAYYFRSSFMVGEEINLTQTTLSLRAVIDDGAVVYLNGEELFRVGMNSGLVRHQDFASRTVANAEFEGPFSFLGSVLKHGENVIAVEAHQTNATSSDIVFGLEASAEISNENDPILLPVYYTTDGSDPRLEGGAMNPKAREYRQPLTIDENTRILARSKDGEAWSALSELALSINAPLGDIESLRTYLRITEVMYNPSGGAPFEFIELHNAHPSLALALDGAAFTQGIQYAFPADAVLRSNQTVVVANASVENEIAAWKAFYHIQEPIVIFGPYSGQLANSGERITLSSSTREDIVSFEYSDGRGWPIQADGAGHSLVPTDAALALSNPLLLDYGGNWRASFAIGGSPGRPDELGRGAADHARSIVINEFMASTDHDDPGNPAIQSNDWIELHNPTAEPIAIRDLYLSDNDDDLAKWKIPEIVIPAFGFASFDEVNDFHNANNSPADAGFGLNGDGENIFLSYLPDRYGEDRVLDAIPFKAQEPDISLGRHLDGFPYWHALAPSRGASNARPRYDLYISEIMYAPRADDPNATVNLEYIEIVNQTGETIDLGSIARPFRMDGGVDFAFAQDTILQNQERLLVVGFDPADAEMRGQFVTQYQLANASVQIAGPYAGKLSNEGERIALEKALRINAEGLPDAWNIQDEAIYFVDSPWSPFATASGLSLRRMERHASGNDPYNWIADEPSPGSGEDGNTVVGDWAVH